eukprot:9327383-Lingulodinium_polyedra.AAC.1
MAGISSRGSRRLSTGRARSRRGRRRRISGWPPCASSPRGGVSRPSCGGFCSTPTSTAGAPNAAWAASR